MADPASMEGKLLGAHGAPGCNPPPGSAPSPRQDQPALGPGESSPVNIGNFKSALNEAVMKVTQRPLSADDIHYKSLLVTMAGGVPQYQSTVRINAIEGREFEGRPQGLRKAAEQSAAQVALQQLTSALGGQPGSVLPQGTKLLNYKGRLQELLVQDRMKVRLFGAPGETGPVEVSYLTLNVPQESGRPLASKYCSKVHVAAADYQMDFNGEVCKDRKTAEQSAAYVALQQFLKRDNLPSTEGSLPPFDSMALVAGQLFETVKPSAKSELNELVMKILSRPATVQDIVYSLRGQGNSPFTAVVSVPSLATGLEFEGVALPQKKAAEQSAATEALKHFKGLPQVPKMAPKLSPPPVGLVGHQLGQPPVGKDGAALLGRTGNPRLEAVRTVDPAKRRENGGNHKSALNEFVMKLAGRPLTAGDILYTSRTSRLGQFQATAKIPVVDDMEFQAAPRARKQEAEQCAAQIALLYYQAKYPGGGPPRVPSTEGEDAGSQDGPAAEASNFKSSLNELAMRIAGRPLETGDVNYVVIAIGAGRFQAVVKPTIIDADLEFTGDIATRKKDAEHIAAAKALEHLGNLAQPIAGFARMPPMAVAPRPTGKVPFDIDGEAFPPASAHNEVGNFKSALNELFMRSCRRPLAQNDVTYIARPSPTGNMFLSAVKVPALDPEREFDGEPRARKKDAEQAAAKAALLHFQSVAAPAAAAGPV